MSSKQEIITFNPVCGSDALAFFIVSSQLMLMRMIIITVKLASSIPLRKLIFYDD